MIRSSTREEWLQNLVIFGNDTERDFARDTEADLALMEDWEMKIGLIEELKTGLSSLGLTSKKNEDAVDTALRFLKDFQCQISQLKTERDNLECDLETLQKIVDGKPEYDL